MSNDPFMWVMLKLTKYQQVWG